MMGIFSVRLLVTITLTLGVLPLWGAENAAILSVGGLYLNNQAHIADINGDGLDDILTFSSEQRSAMVLYQKADGRFYKGLSTYLQYDHPELQIDAFHAGDFNGDQKLDFLVVYEQRFISFYQGAGTDTFVKAGEFEIPFDLDIISTVGDLNGDHQMDLLVTTTEASEQQQLPVFTFAERQKAGFPLKMKFSQLDLA
ncbi:MAG: VCBS repeat-containing protein, partial [Bdellovibrionales bacterium]|nr:VCBS repeat-containing protein [Bdellovibrionales bacterium]